MVDFGCGIGTNLSFFKDMGYDVFGIDISSNAINRCIETHPEYNKDQFYAGNVLDFDSLNDVFNKEFEYDLLLSLQTMVYLKDEDIKTALGNMSKSLKENGIAYITMRTHAFRGGMESVPENNKLFVNKAVGRISNTTYINLCRDKEDMIKKFEDYFEPLYTLKTSIELEECISEELHFIGRKK